MIAYFGGPEGGGKTALMTKFCRIHHLAGGVIWAFPGYEHKNSRGRVVSDLILPEQVMGRLDDMQYIVIVIDEIQNFMQHHKWYSNLTDIMAYGAAAQRRKRQFVILATGPIFDWVPKDLRMMFHIVFECRDRHWREKYIPRGQQILFTIEDKRGVLSGYPGMKTREKRFFPKDVFPYYDTFSLVDPKYQFLKMNIQRDEVFLDSDGNVISSGSGDFSHITGQFAGRSVLNKEAIMGYLAGKFREMNNQGIDRFDLEQMAIDISLEMGTDINISSLAKDFLKLFNSERISARRPGIKAIYSVPEFTKS